MNHNSTRKKRLANGDVYEEPNNNGAAYATQVHANAGASHNSFSDKDMEKTPRGSVHTNKNMFDGDDNDPATSGPTQFSYKSNANNKIRVVIRMRPYLNNEHEMLQTHIKQQSQGNLRLQAEKNAIK